MSKTDDLAKTGDKHELAKEGEKTQHVPATIEGGGVVSTGTGGGIASGSPDPEAVKELEKANPDWKDNYPQAKEAGASREEYQKTADERRVQAEARANQEEANREKLEGDPQPTGDSIDPNAKTPELEKHGGDEPKQ